MNETFNLGDVVELKSGSPKMTVVVVGTDNKFVWVTWYDESTNKIQENYKLPLIAIKISS